MGKILLTLIGIIAILPNIAHAHEVAGGGGFMSGLSHPVLGLDHLLAMISVGILSAQMGGNAIWRVPATFIAVMLVGGILGIVGIEIISVELGIVLSVLALGIAITAAKQLPTFLAMIFVGFFALFHGHAHGSEMPYLASPTLYALGFVAGSACIHITGVAFALVTEQLKQGKQLLRYLGASIAGIGFHMMIM